MEEEAATAAHGDRSDGLAYLFWTTGRERKSYVRLKPAGVTIGSGPRSDAVIADADMAPEQARIRNEDGAWFMYDLSAGGATRLEGTDVYRAELHDGARVTLGHSSAIFRVLE